MSSHTCSARSFAWLVARGPFQERNEKAGLMITAGVAMAVLLLCGSGNAGAQAPAETQARLRNAPVLLPVAAEPNRLNSQVLVHYYERDWKDIVH